MILNRKFNVVTYVWVSTVCFVSTAGLLEAAEIDMSEMEALYMQTCYICHGDDGTGYMPGVPDLNDNKRLFSDDEARIAQRIKQGMDSNGSISMPPKGGNPNLSDKEILALVKYVKQLLNSH